MKDLISARRKELGLTQQQLAEKLNISDKVVSKWETGRSLPDTSLLLQLADALSLSVDDLLHTGETNQSAVRQAAMREANSKFKNLFIITTALQSIAMILSAAGRLIRVRMQDYGRDAEIISYLLTVLAVLIEIGAVSYYLAMRNHLLTRYPESAASDQRYVGLLLCVTYFLLFIPAAAFVLTHGLTFAEQLIALLIFALALLILFGACYIWNRKRKR